MTKKNKRKKRRTSEQSLKLKCITRPRRQFVDYDYLQYLSLEDKEWLARFTDEYYGAGLIINPTYIIENGEMVNIDDRDLRKFRKVQKFYKTSKGDFTTDERSKYSKVNLHSTKKMRTDCNIRSNDINRDMLSAGYQDRLRDDDFYNFLENQRSETIEFRPDYQLKLKEEYELLEALNENYDFDNEEFIPQNLIFVN